MKKSMKFTFYFCLSIVYFFSADIISSFDFSPFLNKGHISNALRLPVMGGASILFVLTVARIINIPKRTPFIVSSVIGIGTLGMMVISFFSLGSNINIFQLLWYVVSAFTLAIISCFSFLISVGIIRENHIERWV